MSNSRVVAKICTIREHLVELEQLVAGGQFQEQLQADLLYHSTAAEILCNPNKLSIDEFNIIKLHPTLGCEILKGLELPWPIAQIIHQNHERTDGSGYPLDLSGKDILLEA